MLSRGWNLARRHASRTLALESHEPAQQQQQQSIAVEEKQATDSDRVVTVYEDDPAPYFFSSDIQKLLRTITRPDPKKVFRTRLDGHRILAPEYKFMTDEQLEKAQKKANHMMERRLQMPPIVKVREEDGRIISNDPALAGFSTSKIVFTDITYGLTNKNRTIVIREPNGILRPAKHMERDRLNQVYFPLKDREIKLPKMFEDENLKPILERGDYEFILDRVCVQFDPDHPDFHRITQLTYEHCNENLLHDKLRSTRHYGPMIFYLAWIKNINNVLLENILGQRVDDAVLVVKLLYRLHPSEKAEEDMDGIQLLQYYITEKAIDKRKLSQALQTYIELENEKKQIEENIAKAHGKTSSSHEVET